ncbi:MAG: hypothetical protein EBT79_13080, partial [Actinobacteria bacterium]|nr:hypothetical protein [Actinomycetota bacterium]
MQLLANGTASGSACTTDNSTGIWQCTTAALTAGTYNITARSTTVLETGTVTSTSTALSVTIETTLPTITAFSSSNADGSYGVGQLINITATASETVLAGSSFVATLNITPSRTVTLTAATQGTTLTGSYTVQATDTSADLTVSSFTAGTVTDT